VNDSLVLMQPRTPDNAFAQADGFAAAATAPAATFRELRPAGGAAPSQASLRRPSADAAEAAPTRASLAQMALAVVGIAAAGAGGALAPQLTRRPVLSLQHLPNTPAPPALTADAAPPGAAVATRDLRAAGASGGARALRSRPAARVAATTPAQGSATTAAARSEAEPTSAGEKWARHPVVSAEPLQSAPFDRDAAARALADAGIRAGRCQEPLDTRSAALVSVTFAPSGRVTAAQVKSGAFSGTEVGGCIARTLHDASIPPFDGQPVAVNTTIRLR
jgi:hypothetical protein